MNNIEHQDDHQPQDHGRAHELEEVVGHGVVGQDVQENPAEVRTGGGVPQLAGDVADRLIARDPHEPLLVGARDAGRRLGRLPRPWSAAFLPLSLRGGACAPRSLLLRAGH
ncbi:hypothetical protein R8Z50_30325 [Longispora sp. K20-0274]|uniref:hypothetical protein n=1 Tax=Longispora sp. K20-0274 TaxID=3088255 RepID=UPI00399C2513